MRLEYTLTASDVRESVQLTQKQRDGVWTVVVAYGVLFLLGVPIALGRLGEEPADAIASAGAMSSRDLWVTLAPGLVGVTLAAGGTLVTRWRLVRYGAPVPGRAPPTSGSYAWLVVVCAAFAWLVLPNAPMLAIPWRPTLRRELWAAVVPWFAYGLLTCWIALSGPRHTAALLVAQVRSMQRPATVDLTDDAVVTADGVVESRIGWSHFVSFGETPHLLLLATEDGGPLILPKRAVPDEVDQRRLRRLIRSRIPSGAFLPRQGELSHE